MSKPILILLVTTGALGLSAAYFHTQLKAERSRADVLELRVAELERAADSPASSEPLNGVAVSMSERTSDPVMTPAATGVAPHGPGPDSVASAPSPENRQRMREGFMRQQQVLMNDPEYREAMRMQHRMGLLQSHPDLARELGISTAQANQLLDLLAEQQLQSMQNMRPFTAGAGADPTAMAEMQRKAEERNRANQAEIAQVIGDDGLQRWQDYQNTMGSRYRVRQLSSAFEAAGIPLREDQQQPLRQALAEHERQMRLESQTYATQTSQPNSMTPEERLKSREEQLDRLAQTYERARNSVSGILSAEQMETYERLHQQELTLQRAQLRVQRAQIEAAGSDTGASEAGAVFVASGIAFGDTVVMPAEAAISVKMPD